MCPVARVRKRWVRGFYWLFPLAEKEWGAYGRYQCVHSLQQIHRLTRPVSYRGKAIPSLRAQVPSSSGPNILRGQRNRPRSCGCREIRAPARKLINSKEGKPCFCYIRRPCGQHRLGQHQWCSCCASVFAWRRGEHGRRWRQQSQELNRNQP